MKKIFIYAAAMALMCLSTASCKKVIPVAELPQPIQSFLQTHFAGSQITYAMSEPCEYEIMLMDGSELEFKKNGEWKTIDMHHSVVPASVLATLPPTIMSYTESCCPGIPACKIKKGFWYGYKVELVNDFELVFSSKGVFKRIDD